MIVYEQIDREEKPFACDVFTKTCLVKSAIFEINLFLIKVISINTRQFIFLSIRYSIEILQWRKGYSCDKSFISTSGLFKHKKNYKVMSDIPETNR